ncbi:MAG TPA: hypothetical protein VFD92_04675 [Candidatus Binatia bacterium]|nr:hypothetical protein [Candidatus Binatia bacterium]
MKTWLEKVWTDQAYFMGAVRGAMTLIALLVFQACSDNMLHGWWCTVAKVVVGGGLVTSVMFPAGQTNPPKKNGTLVALDEKRVTPSGPSIG